MRRIGIWSAVVGGLVWGALGAAGQEPRVIRPSPAFYQQQGLPQPEELPEAQQPIYHAPRPAQPALQPVVQPTPVPVQPRMVQPTVQPAVQPRPLPPHPRSTQPAAPMKPLPVQPRPGQPTVQQRPQPAAPMTPLPVQPRPVQPSVQPVVQPAPVPVQPRMVQPTVQPAPVPVQPRMVQPTVQPTPVPVQPRMVQPVAPVAAPAPVQPVTFPAAPVRYDEPVYADVPGTRLHLGEMRGVESDWRLQADDSASGYRWPGLALGPKFGTTGVGADLTFGVTRFLNLRGGFNYAAVNLDKKFGGVKYDTDLEMIGIPLLVDLYPAGGHFRLTGGVFIQPSWTADLSATPGSPVQIGNHVYRPDVVGTLTGKIEADPLAPYLGIGFGNAVGEDQWLTFSLDIGVVFQTYDVSLASNGAGMTTKLDTFREDMKKEEQNLQKDADNFKFYPVLTLGISYHF